MGTGVRTFMVGSAPYIVVVAALTVGSRMPSAGALAGLGFGLGRGLVPLGTTMHRDPTAWDQWAAWTGRRVFPVVTTVTVALLGAGLLWQVFS